MYHGPVFITVILIGAHFYYGVLENYTPSWLGALTGGWITSYSPTFVTILAAIGAGIALRPVRLRQMAESRQRLHHRHQRRHPHQVAGIVAVCAVRRRSPSHRSTPCACTAGTCGTPRISASPSCCCWRSQHTASLSVQYGNVIWANVLIWTLGALILWKIGKLHIPVTFAVVYLLLSPLSQLGDGQRRG